MQGFGFGCRVEAQDFGGSGPKPQNRSGDFGLVRPEAEGREVRGAYRAQGLTATGFKVYGV